MDYTPVFPALTKKDLVFLVPRQLMAIELAISGIIIFVLHFFYLLIPIFIIHTTVAILEKRESSWFDIVKFIFSLPREDYAMIESQEKYFNSNF